MLELAQLAQQVVDYVKPHLLAAAGNVAVETASQAPARVWSWLKAQLTRPAAVEAIQDAEQRPTDSTNLEALVLQLRKELEHNETFRRDLLAQLPAEMRTGPAIQTAVVTGNDNITPQLSGSGHTVHVNQKPK